VKGSWHRFVVEFEPPRTELYRYRRHPTRSPWDAEELVQDALSRAFVTLGTCERDDRAALSPPSVRDHLGRCEEKNHAWIRRS
jgi:DNA-directed RNA polymerase specialized sigma24 family protein